MRGIAVPYVVAIIFAAIIIGIVAYWIFRTAGPVGGALSAEECRTMFLKSCSEWRNMGCPKRMTVFVVNCDEKVKERLRSAGCSECTAHFQQVECGVEDGAWWRYIAPGCEAHGIVLRSRDDCGCPPTLP